jgi:hypothetical protein
MPAPLLLAVILATHLSALPKASLSGACSYDAMLLLSVKGMPTGTKINVCTVSQEPLQELCVLATVVPLLTQILCCHLRC